jgi:hypothetical protein
MSEIKSDIGTFLTGHQAQAIHPVPAALANQRGPSCGFYALAYVLNYWHARFELLGGKYKTEKPLPARTNMDAPKQDPNDRKLRDAAAKAKVYTSLRQYGKFNHLTVLGSVFNADDLVKVAQGEHSQYAGQFDARAVGVTTDNFGALVKRLLDWECPIIVPYDVSVDTATEGEPVNKGGDAAHWVAIIGHYQVAQEDYVVYFNWGGFYTAKLQAFAVSNAQLTSNRHLTFAKYKITAEHDGYVYKSDYMRKNRARADTRSFQQSADDQMSGETIKLDRITTVSKRMHNPEFNDPTMQGKQKGQLDQMDGRNRTVVGGLRNKVVVVFRKEDTDDIAKALAG